MHQQQPSHAPNAHAPDPALRTPPAARRRLLGPAGALGALLFTALAAQGQQQAAPSGPPGAAYSSAAHDALILARREGRIGPGEALERLRAWLAQASESHPARARLAADAALLAIDLDRACDAVGFAQAVPPSDVPEYALAPLVSAARHCGQSALQAALIQVWIHRMPAAREPVRQAAFWHLDTGDLAGAQPLRERLANPMPTDVGERVNLLELDAAMALAQQQRTRALGLYQQMLALQPEHRQARRQTVLMLSEAGGASSAWEQARRAQQSRPGTFTPLELAGLQQAALGEQVGWATAERDLRLGPTRTQPLDEVLAALQSAEGEALAQSQRAGDSPQAAEWTALHKRLRWDHVLALVESGQPEAAIRLYRQLLGEGLQPPFHGQIAAARALARMGRSHEAVRVYEQALAGADEERNDVRRAQLGLIYTYADAGRFDDAHALLERLQQRTPVFLRLAPVAQTPNPEYSELHEIEADLLLMGDRLDAAQARFATLSGAAGMHAGFRAGAATVAQRRDHPERAVAQYEALLADDPRGIQTRAGHAEALMAANEWRPAREQVESLMADAPDDTVVERVQRHHAAATGARLDVEAGGESGNLATANRVWQLDSRLSSGLMNDSWRLLAGYTRAQGETDDGGYHHWHRGALGLSWSRSKWDAEVLLQSANSGPYRHSLAASLAYRLSDQWRLAARFDGDSTQTPWRARTAGIGARSTELEASWIHSERRSIGLTLNHLALSDGNARNGATLQWRERWLSTPRLQVESTLSASEGSWREQQQRPYFSPDQERSVQASVWAQWLTWRENERAFFQGVELSAGGYRQSGFGSGSLWNLRYEHRWQFGPHAQLRYGLSVGSHPYDGRRERQRRIYLQLSVPLY
ncbi:poly-beta-1,6 N-acetyl-D-glucosamine export porin PgaA [Xenophilus arseniciresistens]|uniref:Poly-beta-1,6 N-acetyl-D-glucosamine export porin PgaA n=1 Tax=Xenophilus arseniciresistens TaxID=1283306 RepID=A0AAE3T2J0_9BURK|nr:poly-beta-1,6 N-acetyl-D-glucosamine export porin PgaA [Xenophilus arseniciresistens]MDA7418447.1 poly-beta-1,6 N-acetyl-D-glucosamine export porin PgaA [Xenophilus arseniciresistens]